MLQRIIGILVVLIINITGVCQTFEEKDFTRYTKADGLSHNYITGIVQDSAGYIWVGTNKGLNRFDGKFFTNFFKNAENSPVPENWILSLRLEKNNEILGTTQAGAFAYDPASGRHTYFIVPSDSLIFFWANQAWKALKDKNGNYVVSTKTGLYVFNPAGKIISRYDHFKPADAGRIELWFGNWLSELSNGTVFQENNLGGSLYDPATKKIDRSYTVQQKKLSPLVDGKTDESRVSFPASNDEIFVPNDQSNSLDVYNLLTGDHSSYNVPPYIISDLDWFSKLFYINDSLIALTGKVGGFYLLHYSPHQKKLYSDGKKYFATRYCTSIFKDREGRLWIGTSDGLYKQNIRNSFFTAEDLSLQQPSVLHTGIRSVFILEEKMFIGLGNEGGLLVLDHKTKKIEQEISFKKFGPGSNTINFIFLYHPDTLWVGTANGVLWLNVNNYTTGKLNFPGQPEWMYKTKTRNFLQDSNGDIWLSFGVVNSVIVFNRKERKFYDLSKSPLLKITFCFSMAEDKNKNIWLAGDGLCRWNRKKNVIDTLIPYPSASESLHNYMEILDCDENNNLWISSYDNEILQYDCNNNRMYLRLRDNSAIDGYSQASSQIINDHIWQWMLNGISAFNIKDYSIKQFNYADGLPSAITTSYRKSNFYDEPNRRFYFGASHYLISFIPDVNLSSKSVPLFSIEITGVSKDLSGKIILPYSQNNVELRFNVINFTYPEESRFAYRFLNTADSVWSELYTKNILVLSKLPAGNHQIQVKLYSVNNRWPSQVKTISIIIYPPFWKTWWFLTLVALLVAAGIYLLYRRRVNQIQQKADLDKLLAQTEMKALHAQMNPHFIFNCLNSIKEMILSNENRQASHYLSKFAQLIRITLDNSTRPFISLKDTIDYLQRYLEMEQIRTNHFNYSFEIDKELQPEDIFLPPMLIQPLIENAIWHNTLPRDRMLNISIRFFTAGNGLTCIIEDDGIGINASLRKKETNVDHHSVGIENIRQRILVLNEKYNLQSSITIEDKSMITGFKETGTIATLHITIKNSDQ